MSFTIAEEATTSPTATPSANRDRPGGRVIVGMKYRFNAECVAWSLSAYGALRDIEAVEAVRELLNAVRTQRPTLIVVGERLITEGAREILGELAVRMGETRVAVFGDELTDRQLDLIVNNRVTALLSRSEPIRTINEHLVRAASGIRVLSPLLADRVQLTKTGEFFCVASKHLKRLTDRQWDVLLRIAEGRRVSEVARELEISPKAVESHKYRIMREVGVMDRVELCRWAIREGLIEA
ncbi:MAG: response regulator transcription factor [Planctomycetaceae bacterium]|nr:response regulator transcription factor [Planctomycetaceae bacterium]